MPRALGGGDRPAALMARCPGSGLVDAVAGAAGNFLIDQRACASIQRLAARAVPDGESSHRHMALLP